MYTFLSIDSFSHRPLQRRKNILIGLNNLEEAETGKCVFLLNYLKTLRYAHGLGKDGKMRKHRKAKVGTSKSIVIGDIRNMEKLDQLDHFKNEKIVIKRHIFNVNFDVTSSVPKKVP